MERYYGYNISTLYKMRQDLMSALQQTVQENYQYPADGCLYTRIKRMSREIADITEELESRHDDQIERI